MFGYPVRKSFSFIKILNGISKTLNMANQIIPIYQKTKPAISNAKNILGTIKNINISDKPKKIVENNSKKELKNSPSNNMPQFFI